MPRFERRGRRRAARWTALGAVCAALLVFVASPLLMGACRCGDDRAPGPSGPSQAALGTGPTLLARRMGPQLQVHEPAHAGHSHSGLAEGSEIQVVAWVNDRQILRQDLDAALERRLGGLRGSRADRSAALRNRERRRVVEQLVEQEMLSQYMAEQGIEVSDEVLDAALAEEIDSVFHGPEHFARYLGRRNLTPEAFREQRRFEMRLDRLLATRGGVEASEEEVQAYYEQHRESWRAPERVLASCITIRLDRDAPEADVTAALEQLTRLRADILAETVAFEDAARQHSQSPDRYRGGDMGWVYRDDPDLDPLLAEVLFGLPVGQLSEPVRTTLGVQLFWSRDHRAEGYRAFDEVRDSLDDVVEQREEQALRGALVHELEQRFDIGYNEGAFGLEPE